MNTKKKGLTSFLSTLHGAGGRTRTGTVSPPVDFEFYRLRGNEWTVIPYGGP